MTLVGPPVRKLHIGGDVDGVLDQHWYHRFCQWYNAGPGRRADIILDADRLMSVWLEQAIGCGQAEAGELVGQFMSSQSAWAYDPPPGAIRALHAMSPFARFSAMTSRDKHWEEQTENWLKRIYGGLVASISWTNYMFRDRAEHSKSEACHSLRVDILIDDRPDYVLECANAGIVCILFGAFRWTDADQALLRGNPRIYRAASWHSVPNVVEQIRAEWPGLGCPN